MVIRWKPGGLRGDGDLHPRLRWVDCAELRSGFLGDAGGLRGDGASGVRSNPCRRSYISPRSLILCWHRLALGENPLMDSPKPVVALSRMARTLRWNLNGTTLLAAIVHKPVRLRLPAE